MEHLLMGKSIESVVSQARTPEELGRCLITFYNKVRELTWDMHRAQASTVSKLQENIDKRIWEVEEQVKELRQYVKRKEGGKGGRRVSELAGAAPLTTLRDYGAEAA